MGEKFFEQGKVEALNDDDLSKVTGGSGFAYFTAPDGTRVSLGEFKSEAEASKKAFELMAQYQGGSCSFVEDL